MFFLCLIVVLLIFVQLYAPIKPKYYPEKLDPDIVKYQKVIDSLKAKKYKPKIYPFNPNFLSDYKASKWGMSIEEIDKLLSFRKQNKYVNSAKEFQELTGINDSLLAIMSPYFKFPEWTQKKSFNKIKIYEKIIIKDINKATAEELTVIKGIGEKLSDRIIKYRNAKQYIVDINQLYEVWGIDSLVIYKVISRFKVLEEPTIKKIDINEASFKEILKTPYIDYELTKKIMDYKLEVAEIQSLYELKNIEGFPADKFDIICKYLKI